jgi:preprotein translocase subunit SecF
MIRHFFVRRFPYTLGLVLLAASMLTFSSGGMRAGQDAQQGQQQQAQPDQSQAQGQQQEKPKKKGGFLSGVKAMTESSKEQTSATASAGTKGIGDQGTKVGEVTPTPADKQAVTKMETYAVPQGDLTKFIEAGHLNPKQ